MTASISSITADPQTKDWDEFTQVCRAIQMGDWEKSQEFFSRDKRILTCMLNKNGHRSIHIAIGDPENINFLEKLLEQIDQESLPTLVDDKMCNPLHFAALVDNLKAAKMLVDKNPHLLFQVDAKEELPIHKAVYKSYKSDKTTFIYFLQACKQHIELSEKVGHHNPFEDEHGVRLLDYTIWSGFFDIAYDLLKDYPQLASIHIPGLKTPLTSIAQKRDAYLSAERYNFYQRFVYSHLPYDLEDKYKNKDIENQETRSANPKGTKSCFYHVMERIYVKFWEVMLLHVPHIKHLHEDKVKHSIGLKILELICKEVSNLKSADAHYHDAFIFGVINNIPELIERITRTFPQSIWSKDDNGYRLSQLSIKNRSDHAYNFLVHNVTHCKQIHIMLHDKDRNNLLHLAGQLAPQDKLNMVRGAALQMQRELQWFQEVRDLIPPMMREDENKGNETPIMVQEKLWILIPIGALTCLPIASFATLQLPLLVELVSSTYLWKST
ncbi:hypothetical protein QVD17_17141 [Tagetes erecta]|uniref:Uncharacterized protein n=1 Tax=Tagetes erecta TaxID=13708 RepID=A0AAD8KRR7_TARER|nr:hypothetical protein QVD17_17141 [Tagetes erecta]